MLADLEGDRALAVHLLAVTGARISEAVGLRRCDVLLRTGRVVLTGKTRPRQFPLPEATLALLAPRADGSEAKLLDPGTKAGDGIRDAITRTCQNGVQPVAPHGLRRMVVDRFRSERRGYRHGQEPHGPQPRGHAPALPEGQ